MRHGWVGRRLFGDGHGVGGHSHADADGDRAVDHDATRLTCRDRDLSANGGDIKRRRRADVKRALEHEALGKGRLRDREDGEQARRE